MLRCWPWKITYVKGLKGYNMYKICVKLKAHKTIRWLNFAWHIHLEFRSINIVHIKLEHMFYTLWCVKYLIQYIVGIT